MRKIRPIAGGIGTFRSLEIPLIEGAYETGAGTI
jgi:hypothetical protein